MKILVYPHDLGIGGSQINAIDLAAGAAAAGHEIIVYGVPGPLVEYINEKGLRYIPARRLRYRPAPSRILQLASIARRERIDVIHAYEWPPCLDSYFGAGLLLGIPILCTVLSMSISPYVPSTVPLIMGTADLGEAARQEHRADVWVLEPPIDSEQDHPAIDGTPFRLQHAIGQDETLILTVSRLAIDLKLDALVRAIDAAGILAQGRAVRLVVVGGGEAHNALQERADAVNRRYGREVVTFTGPVIDPRTAYAAADIVVGMGSSALRAMAIGKPVVVQGERGFSETFSPETRELFLRQGFHGVGSNEIGVQRLAEQLGYLIDNPPVSKGLGQYGRATVVSRFSLAGAIPIQLAIYDQVVRRYPLKRLRDAIQSAHRALVLELRNHSPSDKRRQFLQNRELISAARQGSWPPPA